MALVRTPNYGHLVKERNLRAKLAGKRLDAASKMEEKLLEVGKLHEGNVWGHACRVYLRVIRRLEDRGGAPQPGAPR